MNKNKKLTVPLYLAITSFITVSICSKCSFLYPFNDWVDPNCYMTVAKSMVNGRVLYADIYEQKGPWLYFLHILARLISPDTFFGAYLMEIAACFTFLIFVYKIAELYKAKITQLLLPVLAMLIYSGESFCHGDSAEELCLPLLAAGLYISFSAIKEERFFTKCELFFIGLSSGIILWIKYTILGFYIGFIIIPMYFIIKKRAVKEFFKYVFLILSGVAVASVPVVVYFGLNGGFSELFRVYFYNNIFIYSEGSTILDKLQFIFIETLGTFYRNKQYSLPILVGIIWLLLREKIVLKLNLLFIFSAMVFFTYFGGTVLPYYGFTFVMFTVFGFIAVERSVKYLLKKLKLKDKAPMILKRVCCCVIAVLSLATCIYQCYRLSPNVYLMQYEKEDLPQFKFAQIINKQENATLLNYGFIDGGFYMAADILPTCKYFCGLNIKLDDLKNSQDAYIKNKKVDFVVCIDNLLESKNYRLISSEHFYNEDYIHIYYLYKSC